MLLKEFKSKIRRMDKDYELDNLCLEWLDGVARDRQDLNGKISGRLLACITELLRQDNLNSPPEPPGTADGA